MLYRCCGLVCDVLIFFFKQKTAYEMRISDWSSDVCSSDLRLDDAGRTKRQGLRHAAIAAMGLVVVERQRIDNAAAGKGQAGLALEEGQILGQIGRASCRERVCQCV